MTAKKIYPTSKKTYPTSQGHTRHGFASCKNRNQEYRSWQSMKYRCYNKKSDDFTRYGKRGIIVCELWINSFEQFIKDVGLKPSKEYVLDRIDNDGNYEPGNVKWSTPTESVRNRNVVKSIQILKYSFNLPEWSEISGIKRDTITKRLISGWTSIDAIFQFPLNTKDKSKRKNISEETVCNAVSQWMQDFQEQGWMLGGRNGLIG